MDFYRTGVGLGERSVQASERNGRTPSEEGQKRAIRGYGRNGVAVRKSGERLRAIAGVLLTLAATMPASNAQQAGGQQAGEGTSAPIHNVVQVPDKAASELPVAPAPVPTEPIPLRTSSRDYSKAVRKLAAAIRSMSTAPPPFQRRASPIRCG